MSIGLYIDLAPLYLKYSEKLQEKRFDFIKSLASIIPENAVKVSKIKYFIPNQQTLINESGLYTAIMGSQMKNAKLFKRWVTKDVLPSIRKTGTYGQPQLPDNPMEMLKIHCAALEQVDKKVDAVDGKVGQLKSRITDLEDTMMLDHGQEYYLEKTVNKTVISALGGKESNAYKQIGRKVFAECNGDLKAYFKVNARGNIPRKRYEEAVKYAENWKPCMNTQMLIDQHNAQQRLEM